jgi:glycosyltransferase involved in cell wall biosynthesis
MIQTRRRRAGSPNAQGRGRPQSQQRSVYYVAPGDVAKGRVEPISWMQTCRAYAEQGQEVVLVTLQVQRPDGETISRIWNHYAIAPDFAIRVFRTPLRRDPSLWWFRTWAGLAALHCAAHVAAIQIRRPRNTIIHARLPVSIAPFLLLNLLLPSSRRARVVLETHSIPRVEHAWILRKADLIVTNSEKLAADISLRLGIRRERVLHAPLGPYNRVSEHPKAEARAELGLAPNTPVACYAGKLTREHVEFFLRAAANVAQELPTFRFMLVGGNPEILEWTRRRAVELRVSETIILTGFVPPARVSQHLAAADVLAYYMPESFEIFSYCTPAKGYDYQAAGRPIVATEIPLYDEVFGKDGERAIRVYERTPEAFAKAILRALALGDGASAMAERAKAWVAQRTWERRTKAILDQLDV